MSNEIAQRLRRFRRPAGVAEILKPSVRTRVSGWAFLAVVAVLAVTVGAGLTALSKTDTAQRGMNGVLSWMQDTGMPMRPAMSGMMTTESDPVAAHDAAIATEVRLPSDARPGTTSVPSSTPTPSPPGSPAYSPSS